MRSARAARVILPFRWAWIDTHASSKTPFQDCERLRIEIHFAKLRHLALLTPSGGLRIPEQAAHDSGMMPPTHSEIIPPTVPR
jgi:hypothetical protein